MLSKKLFLNIAEQKTAAFDISFWVEETNQTYSRTYYARDITPNLVSVFGVSSLISNIEQYSGSNWDSTLEFSDGYEFSPENDWCFISTSTGNVDYLLCESSHKFFRYYASIISTEDTGAFIEFFRKKDQKLISVKLNAIDYDFGISTLDGDFTIRKGNSLRLQLPANSFINSDSAFSTLYFYNTKGCEAFSKSYPSLLRLFNTNAEADMYFRRQEIS